MRLLALAVLLALAATSIVIGLALLHPAAGWIGGGVLGAAWSVLMLSEAS